MKRYKQIAGSILDLKIIASLAVDNILRIHNGAYYLASAISRRVEPNGLHPKHRILDYHQWFSSRVRPGWRVLDVGCGNGALSGDLIKYCDKIVAIDLDPEKIQAAKKLLPDNPIQFILGDAAIYPFEGRFDAVILSNVLEHIRDRVRLLKNVSQYSDLFLIRVPMVDRDWITLYKKERGVPYLLDKGHYIEYTVDSFSTEMAKAGLFIGEYRVRYGELYSVCHKKDQLESTVS